MSKIKTVRPGVQISPVSIYGEVYSGKVYGGKKCEKHKNLGKTCV